jgi:hypothetical protein
MFLALSPILASANTGELFNTIMPFALVSVVILMVLHLAISLIFRGASAERSKWNLWDVLIYLGTLGCVAVLGVTSFGAVMRYGMLDGWPLFLHMCGAGAFTAVLPLLALSWAHINRFEVGPGADQTRAPKFSWLPKLMFWLILAGGFVVTMTMLVSMLPIFGSDGLHTLLDLHRYSGLVVVVALALHFYGVAIQKIGLQ